MDDIILNKKESIERCIKQIRIYYASVQKSEFEQDYMIQDAISANLQRLCEQTIDLANHIIKIKKLGLPKESKESFDILVNAKIINPNIAKKLKAMVGFRNTLVHEYQKLAIEIMIDVVENHLDDILVFTDEILKLKENL
jgi:uncharacterized protein YutE (UPF0331/DUF86 family)